MSQASFRGSLPRSEWLSVKPHIERAIQHIEGFLKRARRYARLRESAEAAFLKEYEAGTLERSKVRMPAHDPASWPADADWWESARIAAEGLTESGFTQQAGYVYRELAKLKQAAGGIKDAKDRKAERGKRKEFREHHLAAAERIGQVLKAWVNEAAPEGEGGGAGESGTRAKAGGQRGDVQAQGPPSVPTGKTKQSAPKAKSAGGRERKWMELDKMIEENPSTSAADLRRMFRKTYRSWGSDRLDEITVAKIGERKKELSRRKRKQSPE